MDLSTAILSFFLCGSLLRASLCCCCWCWCWWCLIGVQYVDKVLDIENGARCFVLGIIYVDNPLKPSILDEVNQEVRLSLLFSLGLGMISYGWLFWGCAAGWDRK